MRWQTERNRYVRFSHRPDRLRVYLLPEGRRELREWRKADESNAVHGFRRNDLERFLDLIEDFLCNGWTIVRPEQVGDLRDDAWLVISNDYTYADENDDDELIVGTAYHYPNYVVDSYIDPLVRQGYLDLEQHVYLTPQEFDFEVARLRPDLIDSEGERERLLAAGKWYTAFHQAEWAGQLRLPFAEAA